MLSGFFAQPILPPTQFFPPSCEMLSGVVFSLCSPKKPLLPPKVPTDKQMYCKRDPAAKTLLLRFEFSLSELSSY